MPPNYSNSVDFPSYKVLRTQREIDLFRDLRHYSPKHIARAADADGPAQVSASWSTVKVLHGFSPEFFPLPIILLITERLTCPVHRSVWFGDALLALGQVG